jgi:Cu(I)/Ag(I) efflux system membrane fusion protein
MKKLLFVSLLIIFWACNSKDQQEQKSKQTVEVQDQPQHERGTGMESEEMKIINPHEMDSHSEDMTTLLNVPAKFHDQLNGLYNASLELTDAFVESDTAQVKAAAARLIDQLVKVDGKLLEPQAHEIWMGSLMNIAHMLNRIKQSNSLEEQRQSFAVYNRALYRSFKFLGHEGDPIYYQYCPMAFDNKGAYWLSNSEEIRNPYFGDKMLTCGSTKEVIN